MRIKKKKSGRPQNLYKIKQLLGPSANIEVAQKWLAAKGPRGPLGRCPCLTRAGAREVVVEGPVEMPGGELEMGWQQKKRPASFF